MKSFYYSSSNFMKLGKTENLRQKNYKAGSDKKREYLKVLS